MGSTGKSCDSLLSNGCVIEGMVVDIVLSPGVFVEAGAEVRDSIIMNDIVIRKGTVVDHCVLDKEIEIGAAAQVGAGDDNTPNQLEPADINTGIKIVGKRAKIPAGAVIGRNCRIDPNTTGDDYDQLKVSSGGTISQPE